MKNQKKYWINLTEKLMKIKKKNDKQKFGGGGGGGAEEKMAATLKQFRFK